MRQTICDRCGDAVPLGKAYCFSCASTLGVSASSDADVALRELPTGDAETRDEDGTLRLTWTGLVLVPLEELVEVPAAWNAEGPFSMLVSILLTRLAITRMRTVKRTVVQRRAGAMVVTLDAHVLRAVAVTSEGDEDELVVTRASVREAHAIESARRPTTFQIRLVVEPDGHVETLPLAFDDGERAESIADRLRRALAEVPELQTYRG